MIDSINDEEELHQTQKNELDKRLEYYKDNPNDVMDWQDAKTKLLSR